jgi:hypothetical protein
MQMVGHVARCQHIEMSKFAGTADLPVARFDDRGVREVLSPLFRENCDEIRPRARVVVSA